MLHARARALLAIPGHLGLWPGLYAVGAYLCLTQLSGLTPRPLLITAAAISILLTATGAYALDRVKLLARWIDPADIEAQPERYAYLVPRARAVRAAAFALLLAGGLAGLPISRWAPLSGALAAFGVILYAPVPRRARPRPKDALWLKNLYVALGLTAFAALAALAATAPTDSPAAWLDLARARVAPLAVAIVLVALRVALDAALCDIDDEPTDRLHGTSTFSTRLGPRRAWLYTGLARAVLIVLTLAATPCPLPARLAWSAVLLLGTLALRLRRPANIRDPVDLRLPIEAALTTALLAAAHRF